MDWAEIVKKYPEANLLQSPEYGKSCEKLGAKVIVDDFDGVGYAQMIVRDAKRGRYLEIPCGPLLDWTDKNAVKTIINKISEIAKKERCVFVRIRPQLISTTENISLLKKLGFKKSPMHLAAENTVLIDLTKTEEELLAGMRRQTRYDVRRAEKMGIKITKSDDEDVFRDFHKVQLDTAKRQGFVPPSLKALLAEREAFMPNIAIYAATTDKDELIAYGMIIGSGEEADYYEAASTSLNRKLPGAYALLWKAILDAKTNGYKRFNLWGIAPKDQPNHRYAGVTTFKTGFGGAITEYVPAHDLVISRVGYLKDLVVEKTRKKRRHL